MLHVGDINSTYTFISYILMFELCMASLSPAPSLGRNAKLKRLLPTVHTGSAGRGDDMTASAYHGPQVAAMI